MQRNQELVDFEIDPETMDVRIFDTSPEGDDLLASVRPARLDPEPIRLGPEKSLAALAKKRAISPLRADKDDIIAACGAKSTVDIALRGHGLSLSDQFWYRVPGGTERWEDINFFENEWDPNFGAAVLKRDYAGLASCSPNTPDVTTCGHAPKTWERNDGEIFLIKEPLSADGGDLIGAKLASDLCDRLFGEGYHTPVNIVERYGRLCSSSPHMLAADEELAEGNRLRALAGMQEQPGKSDGDRMSIELFQSLIDAYTAVGVANASAHIARMACCFCLTFTTDFHSGNFGIIRKVGTDTWRPAPMFDFEGSFGLSYRDDRFSVLIGNPDLAKLYCANQFSFVDPSWDWSWYDPRALDSFEDHIAEALAANQNLHPRFGEVATALFAMQRAYVTRIASTQA
jgi:hypothetical protein